MAHSFLQHLSGKIPSGSFFLQARALESEKEKIPHSRHVRAAHRQVPSLQDVQILTALALTVVQAHLVEYITRQVQTEGSLAAVQFRQHLAFTALPAKLAVTGLAKSYLLQDSDQQLVHVVLNTRGGLDELALPRRCQLFSLCEKNVKYYFLTTIERNVVARIELYFIRNISL